MFDTRKVRHGAEIYESRSLATVAAVYFKVHTALQMYRDIVLLTSSRRIIATCSSSMYMFMTIHFRRRSTAHDGQD